MTTHMAIQGKHFVISGSAKRLARAVAESFLSHGAKVTAHYHQSKDEALELQKIYPKQVNLVQADLSALTGIEKVVEAAKVWGPIDGLINSASLFFPTPLGTVTEAQWDTLFWTNVKSHFFLIEKILPQMGLNSSIINIVDIHAEKPMPRHSPYTAAKGAFLTLTRNLALELAPKIRVNAVSPGHILPPEGTSEAQAKAYASHSLFERFGDAKDIVEAVRFLLENGYITGFNLKVDGGASIK